MGNVLRLLASLFFSRPERKTLARDERETAVIRNPKWPRLFDTATVCAPGSGKTEAAATPYELMRAAADAFRDLPMVGRRDGAQHFSWQTYGAIMERTRYFASALLALGLKRGDAIGFYSNTREEFLLLLFACSMLGMVLVPLYDTLGPDAACYIIRHASVKLLFVSPAKLVSSMGAARLVPRVVVLDAVDRSACEQACNTFAQAFNNTATPPEESDVSATAAPEGAQPTEVIRCSRFEQLGADNVSQLRESPAAPEDLLMIMYTSGTTGNPKGVMLSNRACLAGCIALPEKMPSQLFEQDLCYLSYLPQGHIYASAVELAAVRLGAHIGYYSGDIKTIVDDIKELKPTVFAGVPRVFQRIHDAVEDKILKSSIITRVIFHLAFHWKYFWLLLGSSSPLADKLVFNKIKAQFGGKIIVIISAGAPLPVYIAKFLRVCVADLVLEGYGLTETSGMGMSTDESDDMTYGHVGLPYCTNELKLVSVPEMGYLATDNPPRGEICVRGPTCFDGYFQNPEQTAEVLDSDRWIHTGDIGTLTANGKLKVIDRAKNLFKLAQGEYVSPEELEDLIRRCPAVADAYVYGDSEKTYPVAIIVPQQEYLATWAAANSLTQLANDFEALCRSDKAVKHIMSLLQEQFDLNKVAGFKRVQRIHLHSVLFEQDDLVTPSFKLKRHVLRKFFAKQLQRLYSGHS
eukprot:TRINITY_DN2261_c0_g1_i1.p1 TRINITY_DN2261_c0_g1~~TRINITY_DN2261_c0_g1_i1.p1  ORF type:complete len:690 (+),score=174.60 TRINITY_DN2261_c0_g1_i1:138-2207(+)